MPANEYHFVSHWRVESTLEEVTEVLSHAPDLARWWPSVYLNVKQPEPGGPVELLTKGWLPYKLRWSFRVTESRRPHGFSIEAWGDFDGRGVWTFEQDGPFVNITYDWRIRAEKPLLKHLSFLFKPIFSANHRWAMARGEESLKVELVRRAGAGQQSARQTS
ncbi:MAG TPA: SRPBCC family protein [Bryobacteraceae bacterium]|nr:SRPBCC family protein [Bryobacteraceae bacterium]